MRARTAIALGESTVDVDAVVEPPTEAEAEAEEDGVNEGDTCE